MSQAANPPARLRLVLIGDGESPHLLKWARALQPRVDLWAVSSRGFGPEWDALLPPERRLALATQPRFEGGNAGLLRSLPRMAAWLRQVQPDWLAPHYLSSHGTLAWLAVRFWGVRAQIAGSAWGSDILLAPRQSRLMRWLTARVLRACRLATSDSLHMTAEMKALGAGEVQTFPFGLEALPPVAPAKNEALFFANRGLEALYAPERVLAVFAALSRDWPEARLVVANDGALRSTLQAAAPADRVQFVGRLDAATQAQWYAQARWYLSLPQSDSVSVSVLEAMGHGCIPILSDLPANRELIEDGRTGVILADGELPLRSRLQALVAGPPQADALAGQLRDWVGANALFPASVQAYVERLQALTPTRSMPSPVAA